MLNVACFTFNPFQENTYLVYDETRAGVLFDPGCWQQSEKDELLAFIRDRQIRLERLINTHCHIDHILGNQFIAEKFGLQLEIHRGELPVLEAAPGVAAMFGMPYTEISPMPGRFIEDGDQIMFGHSQLQAKLVPGHSPASLCFFSQQDRLLIAGDVLFQGSIGRTDLPGGDYDTLIRSIRERVFPLGDDVVVYPGHGPETTVGVERKTNPFLV